MQGLAGGLASIPQSAGARFSVGSRIISRAARLPTACLPVARTGERHAGCAAPLLTAPAKLRDTSAHVLGSRIGQVAPSKIVVSSRGQARLELRGTGHGLLRVAGQGHWVWGAFDLSVAVSLPAQQRHIEVTLWGLGGRARVLVECAPSIDLQPPRLVSRAPLIATRVRVPQSARLTTRHISCPRVVQLCRASLQSTASEGDPRS